MNGNERIARRSHKRVAVFVCCAVVVLLLDQISKLIVLRHLPAGVTVKVIPHVLSLTLYRNPGASLGMGSSATALISLLAVVACVALVVAGLKTTSWLWTVLLSFALAGALGNLIDRIIYADGFLNGKVVDFLNYGWSVGNVADIFLMIAGIGIIILIFVGVPFDGRNKDERDGRGEQ